jgi:hypothetical protein
LFRSACEVKRAAERNEMANLCQLHLRWRPACKVTWMHSVLVMIVSL